MSMVKKVSIYNAILEAISNGDELYINNKPLLLKWAKQSYVRIMGVYSLPQTIVHAVVAENRAALSSGTVFVSFCYLGNIDLKPGYWASPYWINTLEAIVADSQNELYILGGSNILCSSRLTWSVQDNDVVFDTNLDGKDVTIDTFALELDAEGNPTIEENYIEPIGKFIQFKLAEKENNMKFRKGIIKPMDMAYAKSLYKDYQTLVAKSRTPTTPSEHEQIVRMLNFPFTGNSLI